MRKKRGNKDYKLIALVVILVLALIGLASNLITQEKPRLGPIESTTSQVIIQSYFAIASSTELSAGVDFGTINTLPATDIDAANNYDLSDQTLYSISLSSDSNVDVDFCTRATSPLTSGGDTIPISNYEWADSNLNDLTNPSGPPGTPITTSFVKGSTGINPGSDNNYRFWLNIDSAQAPGTYTNTLEFEGVQTTTPCS